MELLSDTWRCEVGHDVWIKHPQNHELLLRVPDLSTARARREYGRRGLVCLGSCTKTSYERQKGAARLDDAFGCAFRLWRGSISGAKNGAIFEVQSGSKGRYAKAVLNRTICRLPRSMVTASSGVLAAPPSGAG